jgi:hypothetical protein
VVSFHHVSPPKPSMRLSSPPYMLHARPPHSPWFEHLKNIWRKVKNMRQIIVRPLSLSCLLFTLRPKHFLSILFSTRPQTTFLTQYDRPSLMFVPCIVRLSITDHHYTLIITPLFDTHAPTCFGIHVPSSGSFLCPYELLEGRNGYVVCHVLWMLVVCVHWLL